MKQYVTCHICKKRFVGKIPKGGDGTALMPRKHYTKIPVITNLGFMPKNGTKIVCPGSYQISEEDY